MALGVGDVVRLSTVIKDARNADVINTWDLEILGTGGSGDAGFKDACREWAIAAFSTIADLIHSGASAVGLSFYQRNGSAALTPVSWGGVTFTASGEELPAGTAALIYARTGLRHQLSKKFIGPMTVDCVDNAQFVPACLLEIQDLCDFWLQDFTASNGWHLQPVLWPAAGTGSVALVEALPSQFWAIQRRRRVARGS